MADRKDALTELLAKIEAGHGNDPSDYLCLMLVNNSIAARNAYNGSLDAAKALHEAVLPRNDKGPAVYINDDDLPTRWYVSIYNNARLIGEGEHETNPARAWLIAILTALIEEEPHAQLNNTEV